MTVSTNRRSKKKSLATKSRRSKSKVIFLEKIKITSENDYKNYISPKMNIVSPKIWELTNRKAFYNWLHKYFNKYDSSQSPKKNHTNSSKSSVKKLGFEYNRVQKLVRADVPFIRYCTGDTF